MKDIFCSRENRIMIMAFLSGGLLVAALLPLTVGAQPASAPPGGVVDATFNSIAAESVSAMANESGTGVAGSSQDGLGVAGESSNGYGVSGTSNFDSGMYGTGVYGVEGSGTIYGVHGSGPTGLYGNGSTYGVYGNSSSVGGYFSRNGNNSVFLGTATYSVDAMGSVRSLTNITAPQYCIASSCITSWTQTMGDNSVVTNSITNNAVTFAKLQDISSDRLLGRDAPGTGDPGEIALAGSLAFSGSNSIQLSGDSSAPGTEKYYGTNSGGAKGWYPLPSSGGSGSSPWTTSGDTILPTASYDTLKVGTTSGFADGSMNSGIVASGYYTPGKYSAVTSDTLPTFTYDGRAGMSVSNGSGPGGTGPFGRGVNFFVGNFQNQPTLMAAFSEGGSYAYKLGGSSWGSMSDLRLKDRITPYERGLDEIMALQPIRYHYKANMGTKLQANPEQEYTGFGAQDVQKVIPEAVNTGEDGYLNINADPIHWAAINAIQELKVENDALKARIEALEATVQ